MHSSLGSVESKLPWGVGITRARENGSGDPHLDLVNACLTVLGLMGEVTPPSSSPHPSYKSKTAYKSSGCNHVPQKGMSTGNLEWDFVWKRDMSVL